TGQTVIQLQEIDIVMAIIRVPARALERVQVNSQVRLDIDGISRPVDASISIINDKVDVATRTIEVRIAIPNKNYTIKPGLFVRAEILPEPRTAVVVPRNVILGDPSSPYVFILNEGKAIRRSVRVIEYDAIQVEVTFGLTAGEQIIFGPDVRSLVDGQTLGNVPNVAG
ncbi:MAG: efflux RND transporter periplasmic adaptor subunit, partial [Fimbriimonadaceae bacterium]|nr:efflux RND transporter periplasmic adaptor subunit [Alphaproteobacteria bacterium]